MAKRKLWKVSTAGGMLHHRPESKAAAYRYVKEQAGRYQDGILRSPLVTVYVDNRDGRGWTIHELIDLRDLVGE